MARVVRPFDSLPAATQRAVLAGLSRTACPQCEGGRGMEHSLSIRHSGDGVVKLSCWRVTCGFWCLTLTDPNAVVERSRMKQPEPFTEPTRLLAGTEIQDQLIGLYGLSEGAMAYRGWRVATIDGVDWLVMPIRDMFWRELGVMRRTLSKPKRVMSHKTTALPWLDWWIHPSASSIILVEDSLSACRLYGLGYSSIALLGTNLSLEDARAIRHAARERSVYLALDADATAKAEKLVERVRHVLPLQRIPLQRDIKDAYEQSEIFDLMALAGVTK